MWKDEIKSIFHSFSRAIIWSKKKKKKADAKLEKSAIQAQPLMAILKIGKSKKQTSITLETQKDVQRQQ